MLLQKPFCYLFIIHSTIDFCRVNVCFVLYPIQKKIEDGKRIFVAFIKIWIYTTLNAFTKRLNRIFFLLKQPHFHYPPDPDKYHDEDIRNSLRKLNLIAMDALIEVIFFLIYFSQRNSMKFANVNDKRFALKNIKKYG